MSKTASPATELRYAADITRADVDSLIDYLRGKIDTFLADCQQDSAGDRIVRALDSASTHAHTIVRSELDKLADTDLTESRRLDALHRLATAWEHLYMAVRHWEDQDDYDSSRWRAVHATAPHWEQYHADRAKADAEQSLR